MEHYHVQPASVRGHLAVPTSKSLTHRALIIAAFAANASAKAAQVHNPLRSDDTTLTLEALRRMGYPITVRKNSDGVEVVEFAGKRIPPSDSPRIDIHHSGTSARLLTAVAAIQHLASGQFIEIDGSERMRQRPMQELIQPLSALGAELRHENGFLPIRIAASLPDSENQASVRVDASKSSQFLSALLLIAPLLKAGLRIEIQGAIASQSYSDMTIAQMRDAGVEVKEWRENGVVTHYTIAGGQSYQMPNYTVEGDYSSASYPLAAAAITGGSVTITNLRQHSPQGDRAIVDILQAFGAKVEWKPEGLTLTGDKPLRGVDWDMNSSPDIVPTVAVVAMFATGRSTFRNIEHLRYKESDRVQAVIENIERLGGRSLVEGNALVVEPVKGLHGASIPTFDDHRMAMSFALAGLKTPSVVIENPSCVAKSYPDFWRDFEQLCV
jgi:3-phosphoshikimate 1-carboxyvinyltransferase